NSLDMTRVYHQFGLPEDRREARTRLRTHQMFRSASCTAVYDLRQVTFWSRAFAEIGVDTAAVHGVQQLHSVANSEYRSSRFEKRRKDCLVRCDADGVGEGNV